MRAYTRLASILKSGVPETKPKSPFFLFVAVVFMITLGDAIVAYSAPIYLEKNLQSTFLMGLVLSTSSIVGLIFDFLAGKRLKNKGYKYFAHLTLLCSLLLPVSILLLPPVYVFLILAMVLWGVYYEARIFLNFHLIDTFTSKNDYSRTWGFMSVVSSFAYFLGPLIASVLIAFSIKSSFIAALAIFMVSYVFFLSIRTSKLNQKDNVVNETVNPTIKQTFRVWKTLMRKIWPLWVFTFVVTLVDSAYWTIGIVFSEDLKELHPVGGLLLTAYMFPPIFMGFVLPRLTAKLGKKRTAFICALVAAIFIMGFGLISNIFLLILAVFISSIFLSLATPALYAAYEDYVSRLGIFNNDMIGLEQSAGSIGYIVGPILAGGLAVVIGNHYTFVFAGVLLFLTSILCLVIVPKKIKMPQKELTSTVY